MERVTVKVASKELGVTEQFLRIGLQRGLFPFGIAQKMSGNSYRYYINPALFEKYLAGEISHIKEVEDVYD